MGENILPAIVAGLFGLLPALFQWTSKKATGKSKEHKLTRLSSELEFLERLVNISAKTGKDTNSVNGGEVSGHIQADIERILLEYYASHREKLETEIEPADISLFRRLTLMFKPHSTGGWVVHTIFYMLAIFSVTVILGNLDRPDWEEGDFSIMLLGMFIIFAPLFVVLQRLSDYFRRKEISNP